MKFDKFDLEKIKKVLRANPEHEDANWLDYALSLSAANEPFEKHEYEIICKTYKAMNGGVSLIGGLEG